MRKKLKRSELPELIFGSSDVVQSQQIAQLKKEKLIRSIMPRVYTSNFEDTDEVIVRRNSLLLMSHLFPGSVLSHRSALEFKPSPMGNYYLTGKQRRVYQWPGLTVRMTKGPGPLEDDQLIYDELYASSLERACLENLLPARKVEGERRTVDQSVLEERLVVFLQTRGEAALNDLRDRARIIAETLGWEKAFKKLNQIIGSILTTKPSKILQSPIAAAEAFGEPYDASRLDLFQQLVAALREASFPDRPEKTRNPAAYKLIAFFESYFSNYIEGTTFMVEEAKEILLEGRIITNRSGDSHDILGTYQICQSRKEMQKVAKTPERFLDLLRARHRIVMQGRPDMAPGFFKEKANRAGNTFFVEPKLVVGTLKVGFKLIQSLPIGLPRAIYMMFLVSEVHPFKDGNGRIARIMMNAELVKAGQSKLIIPTVYRDDYMLNLKRLTNKREPDGFRRMMDRAHAFTHQLDPKSFDALVIQLENSNAFKESDEAVLLF